MTLEAAQHTYLMARPALAALIGTRLYPLTVPQDITQPAIAYQRISTVRNLAHDGPLTVVTARIQYTCMANTYANLKAVTAALIAALNGYTGMMTPVRIDRTAVENEIDSFEFETAMKVARVDVLFMYKE
jgi:hypothetical protein